MNQSSNEMLLLSRAHRVLGDIAEKCITNKIKLEISPTPTVLCYDGVECSGYFQADADRTKTDILAFGTGKPIDEWLVVALHEASHMDQFLEQVPAWTDCMYPDNKDASDLYFDWLADETSVSYPIDDIAAKSLMVELDCERRTLQKLYKYGLDDYINPIEYVQKSNSYVYLYLYMKESRRWVSGDKAPYRIDDIWKNCPTTFDGDYTVIPEALLAAYRRNI